MGLLLLQIVPVAVGIAVNPVPIIAALIMAGTRRPVANGSAFIAALIVVMALFGGVVLVLVPPSSLAGSGSAEDYVAVAWLLIGLGFLAAFAVMALRRPARGRAEREPRWMALIDRLGPAGAAVVGINPTRRGAELASDIRHTDCMLVVTEAEYLGDVIGDINRRRGSILDQLERGTNIAVVAWANKTARTAWALVRHGRTYDTSWKSSAPVAA